MIAAIIQARIGSTRLPGKVLALIEGKPMIWHVIERVKQSEKIDKIILAVTNRKEDKKLSKIAKKLNVDFYAGSEKDVLDRYYQAAKKYGADTILRVTGDCPLVDPKLIDKTIDFFKEGNYDHVSTAYPVATFPDGLDLWIFKFSALKKAWKEAKLQSEREHVTSYIWKNPELFKNATINNKKNLSSMRWCVDEEPDLRLVRKIYEKLYSKNKAFLMQDVLDLFKKNPEFAKINSYIIRDAGYKKSIKEDKKYEV